MTTLHLGKLKRSHSAFRLPLGIVTSTLAILARKGRGKSYTAAVLAEELLDAGQVPVIIDPTGAHWGLKASADGKSAGYPVVIFGGDHADLPLEEHAGEVVARSISEQRFPAILDLSHFKKGQTYRFLTAFLETLYRINREPIHLLADEADYYAPQQPQGDQARVLGAMEDIVRRGRIRGIGCTMITQRPQVLAKNVLTQADMLIALGMNHPRDIGAIEEWVAVHGDVKKAELMIASLPALDIGTAWFWAPSLNDTFEIVEIRTRRTFDSSATPKPGEKVTAPKKLAEIDVAKLGAEITASIERAKENDPAELKRRIVELQKQVAAQPAAVTPLPPQRIEVPMLSREDRNLIEKAIAVADGFPLAFQQAAEHMAGIRSQLRVLLDRVTPKCVITPQLRAVQMRSVGAPLQPKHPSQHTVLTNGALPKSEAAILRAIAQRDPRPCSRAQASLISGYSITSSSFSNALSALRSAGYIEGAGDEIQMTEAGRSAVGPIERPRTAQQIQDAWLQRLGKAEATLLALLIYNYPYPLSKSELSAASGYSETSSSFSNALSGLRSAELITRERDPRATEILFEP